jgi:hypothetical protein
MGSELPDNELQKEEQESPLILGVGQEPSSPAADEPVMEDFAPPQESRRLESRRLESRQLALIERMEALLDKAERQGIRPAAAGGWPFQLRTLLPSLAAGILGGGLVLAMQPWLGGPRQAAQSPGRPNPAQPAASPEPVQAQETLQLSCRQPCWLDIRTVDSGKRVYYSLLKGTANLAMGSGLDVFSGRADLVKVRINDGPEQPLLSGRVVGSRVIRPAKPSEPSP